MPQIVYSKLALQQCKPSILTQLNRIPLSFVK